MAGGLSRRRFLGQLAAAGVAPVFVPARVLGRHGTVPPSSQITLASIGLGFAWETGLGTQDTRLLAVCDVQRERRDNAVRIVNQHYGNEDCRAYNDFREVLGRDDIDAVYIATPDHWHALVTIAAARAGKDIYCQKPLTHTVAEGRAVVEAVRRYGVVLQHGTQHRSEWAFHAARELIRGGHLGQLTTIRLGLPGGTQLPPQPTEPVPDGFDYDLWLGPARWAPFTTRRCFGVHSWYFISDYCVGYIAGWGVHPLDIALWGGGDKILCPLTIEGKIGNFDLVYAGAYLKRDVLVDSDYSDYAYWYDYVYLSLDNTYDSNDYYLGSWSSGSQPLDPLEQYSAFRSVSIPNDTRWAGRSLYVLVLADEGDYLDEVNETNNGLAMRWQDIIVGMDVNIAQYGQSLPLFDNTANLRQCLYQPRALGTNVHGLCVLSTRKGP